jgi:hypothetical protein
MYRIVVVEFDQARAASIIIQVYSGLKLQIETIVSDTNSYGPNRALPH